MNKCILCGGDSGFGIICEECREIFLFYKERYLISRQINETTELDESVFEELYQGLTIDAAIQKDRESLFHDPTPDDFIKMTTNFISKTRISDHKWMQAKENRFNRFLQYVEKRIREAW